MNILAIDTTGKHLTVALKHNNQWKSKFSKECNLNHSVVLNNQIQRLLDESGLTFHDIDIYACNVGVGSFTGIRVGISTIKGFCMASPKKLVSVNTFEILAYNEKDKVDVLVPDNRGFYVATFSDGQQICPPCHVTEKPDSPRQVIFDDETDYSQKFTSLIDEKISKNIFADSLEPLYIRKSQAEENR